MTPPSALVTERRFSERGNIVRTPMSVRSRYEQRATRAARTPLTRENVRDCVSWRAIPAADGGLPHALRAAASFALFAFLPWWRCSLKISAVSAGFRRLGPLLLLPRDCETAEVWAGELHKDAESGSRSANCRNRKDRCHPAVTVHKAAAAMQVMKGKVAGPFASGPGRGSKLLPCRNALRRGGLRPRRHRAGRSPAGRRVRRARY